MQQQEPKTETVKGKMVGRNNIGGRLFVIFWRLEEMNDFWR